MLTTLQQPPKLNGPVGFSTPTGPHKPHLPLTGKAVSFQPTTSKAKDQSFRTVEFKLYPSKQQEATLQEWLKGCCRVYNQALEHRIKRWERRKEAATYNQQSNWLTQWRSADAGLESVPVHFQRDALRRVDRGMQGFFRRVKLGQKPGFPRFRSWKRYRSLEQLLPYKYVVGNRINVPKLGKVRARGPFELIKCETQKLLRVIQRPSGWYAQVLVPVECNPLPPTGEAVGIDVGLESLVTLSTGEQVGNPRLLRGSAKKLKRAQQSLSRKQKGSNRRKKAVKRVGRIYEKLARRRKGLTHRISRSLVNRFDGIAYEALNLRGLCRGWLRKHVLDAAWGQLIRYLAYKAESAGRRLIAVDPRGTSQECPNCGSVAPKKLSERVHNCPCGFRCDRDHAAALVILNRGFSPGRGGSFSLRVETPVADPVKRVGRTQH